MHAHGKKGMRSGQWQHLGDTCQVGGPLWPTDGVATSSLGRHRNDQTAMTGFSGRLGKEQAAMTGFSVVSINAAADFRPFGAIQ